MQFKTRDLYNEYAPVPFWSWNNRLEKNEIQKQIRQIYDAKYGGFIIHARAGLDTPYMGEEWLSCVETAIMTAKGLNMKVWIYDEFGFPSGLAGGENLRDKNLLAQYFEYKEEDFFNTDAFAVFVKDSDDFRMVCGDVGKRKYYSVYLKTSESEVDVCDPKVAERLIETTYETYYMRFKDYFGSTVEGFFTDEPQYYRYGTPYAKELENELGDVIKENSIRLFSQGEMGYPFRVKYYSALNRLYTNNYYKTIYEWCENHGCKLTGHTIEEPHLYTQMWGCAGAMPSYEFCQVPGIDHLCRHVDGIIDLKQVDSVAAQFGKNTVLTETFACAGFETDPRRLKYIAEYQYVGGVNYMVQHLMNYSIQGQGITDNPPDFSPHTPWWRDIGVFNEYFAKLGFIFRNSEEHANTLVIHPMQSAYLTYVRERDKDSVKLLESEFSNLTEYLAYNGVKFHYGDETIIERKGSIKGNKFVIGNLSYDYVILPYTETINQRTFDMLSEYVNNGGKLCCYKDFPEYISGEKRKVDAIVSNCDLRTVMNARPIRIEYVKGDKVLSRYCVGKSGEYLFLVNVDEKKTAQITFNGIEAFSEYDVMNGKYFALDNNVKINPCDSVLLKRCRFNEKKYKYVEKDITADFTIKKQTENKLFIDFVRYSKDGENFGESVYYSQMIDELISENYAGALYVRYFFQTEIAGDFTLITGNSRDAAVNIDGKTVSLKKSGYDIMYREATLKNLEKGEHYIEFLFNYYNSPSVRHAYFDEGVTESLRNCAVYDTTIEPVIIAGDFAVFREGVISAVVPVTGTSNLQNKGFKFFSGIVSFEGKAELLSTDCKIRLKGNYMSARIYVNGKLAGKAVLDETVDISGCAVKGENDIRIELTSSLRNLYGPHHVKNVGKYYGISPRWFTFRGCWKKSKAILFNEYAFTSKYKFVPFGLNVIKLLQKKGQ